MKRKSIFLLGAILAGSALVGGTFAAWAVTDNASRIDVKITPGTVSTADTDFVTLEWGTKELINVENLEAGQTVGPFKVGLKATTGDGEAFSKGQLEVGLATGESTDTLINYVTVQVKDEDDAVIATLNKDTLSYKGVPYSSITSGGEKLVKFYVTLDLSAREVYSTIKTQELTLSVDWNIKDGTDIATSTDIYFTKPNSQWGNDIYVYAFGAKGEENAWPGTLMTKVEGKNVYIGKVSAGYTSVVFNDGDDGHQTDDLSYSVSKPYFNGTEWTDAPDLTAETKYYLVGTYTNWTLNGAIELTAGKKFGDWDLGTDAIAVTAGAEFKVIDTDNNWYWKAGSNDNLVIGEAGNYKFGFSHAGIVAQDGTFYLGCEAVQA